MDEAARHFRARAVHCRELARDASDARMRRTLTDMARELDEEADLIEAEDTGGKPRG